LPLLDFDFDLLRFSPTSFETLVTKGAVKDTPTLFLEFFIYCSMQIIQ
jgi:hypothetical protein